MPSSRTSLALRTVPPLAVALVVCVVLGLAGWSVAPLVGGVLGAAALAVTSDRRRRRAGLARGSRPVPEAPEGVTP